MPGVKRWENLTEYAAKISSGDLFGGLTAAVVALPLALAFGVASGLGPIAGLYGAIAVGFFAAIFGGTPAQVSGPTGPMTVVMAAIVASHANNLTDAFMIVMLGGLIQIAFGLLKVGRYVSYTPYSVVSGFMSGTGLIIILIQVLPFFGLPSAPGGPVGAIQSFPQLLTATNIQALIIAAVSLAIMIFWPPKLGKFMPAPLVALIAGTLLAVFVLKAAPVIGDIPLGLPSLHLPFTSFGNLPSLLQPALILALLGSVDSLLTSLVADSITHTQHKSDRELIGQGLGNMAAGLLGGLPGAGATMRTVVNVRAGGRSRASGALHAMILLSLVLGLGPLTERIPYAVLAGILMKVGWDIIDWPYLRLLHTAPRAKVIVMLITLFMTVFVDLITAVSVGLILAGFVTASWMETEELKGVTSVALPEEGDDFNLAEREMLESHGGHTLVVMLRGRFSFASARALVNKIGSVPDSYSHTVIYDLTNAAYFDTSAAFALGNLIKTTLDDGCKCFVSGLSTSAEKTLKSLDILSQLPANNITVTREEAIRRIGSALEQTPE